MFVARKKEIEQLQACLKARESKFIAVFGRRRVGKTQMIREAFGNKFTFYHTGYYNISMKEQLAAFCSSLREAGHEISSLPNNWLEAFELLKDLLRSSSDEKKIVFIDELSWMDSGHGKLVSALEGFWNGWASARDDIILIVCGSSTSWMLDNIVHNKGGLYNRLSLQINLKPFTLNECQEYNDAAGLAFSRQDILDCYMIMGGVPYYWSFIKKGLSLPQNIDEIFFAENAPLKDEFRFLYQSLFKKPAYYIAIIEALAKKKIGMERREIIEKTGLANSGNLSLRLQELESCGFIRKYRDYAKTKREAVYQLIDNFTLFYFNFMENNPNDNHFFSNQINTPAYNTWCGLSFERVCLLHLPQIKQALGISGVLTNAYSFKCKADEESGINGSQIDLLIHRKDGVINMCEMKYSTQQYTVTKSDSFSINHKINDFRTITKSNCSIHSTLITPYGLKEAGYWNSIQSVITMDDLFVAL